MSKFLSASALSLFFPLLCVATLHAQTNPLSMTTMEVVKDMGLGINLGNTFESNGSWINGNTVNAYETAWGSPTITKAMIDGYASAGFKTVRIPVAWSNLMTGNSSGGNYTISTALLNRVEEVVNWVLANNMYAIVNIHQDGGWWENFPNDFDECMKKYKRIWTQVSDKFKSHSGYLIFESLNEEGVWNDVWNQWGGTNGKDRAYNMLNAINQEFTTLVRASGGNNGNRHLLIAGYATNIDRTIDAMFKMPTDAKNRQAVSVHYYDPFGFTHHDGNKNDWGWSTPNQEPLMTWGTSVEINQLSTEMNKLKTNFVDKGTPVIVGEYGFAAGKLPRAQSEIRKYTLAVAEAIYTRNMCPVLWDIQLNSNNGEILYYYDRKSNPPAFVDPQLVNGFRELVGLPELPTFILENKISLSNFSVQALSGKRLLIDASSPTVVEIYDIKGKKAANFNVSSGSQIVNLSLPNGVYFAKTQGIPNNIMFAVK
ncbi:MAG: cellulase family glycosylhydrolase [Fibromonadaceae bacterium]|jgi:endoglucanase|nr:cellulase family glycosylhydrolase [Fibromonadaceae bacterium]